MSNKYNKLKTSAQRYTAYRERAPKEILNKLKEWNATSEIAKKILEELKLDNFIDEERFARAFCHDKFLINKWGRIRLKMEMSKYDLSEEAKNKGLKYLNEDDYLKTLSLLARAKWDRVHDTDDLKKRQKCTLYLLQKGFEHDLVREVMKNLH